MLYLDALLNSHNLNETNGKEGGCLTYILV